jgi:cysteine-rich repeat protein
VPTATATPPPAAGCGNGVVEPGEQCDFGDTVDGDGCSHDCLYELLIPGGGPLGPDCVAEWAVVNPDNDPALGPDGLPSIVQRCVDGDPSCDADGIVNDECHFRVAVCFRVADGRIPTCFASTALAKYKLQVPRPEATPARNPTRAANAAALIDALSQFGTAPGGRSANIFTFSPPLLLAAPDNCTPPAEIVVPLRGSEEREEKVRATAETAPPEGRTAGLQDRDTLRLTCVKP